MRQPTGPVTWAFPLHRLTKSAEKGNGDLRQRQELHSGEATTGAGQQRTKTKHCPIGERPRFDSFKDCEEKKME